MGRGRRGKVEKGEGARDASKIVRRRIHGQEVDASYCFSQKGSLLTHRLCIH